jgi:hypothetical protein
VGHLPGDEAHLAGRWLAHLSAREKAAMQQRTRRRTEPLRARARAVGRVGGASARRTV